MSLNLDYRVNELIQKNINLAIPYYLMSAYAYYKEDDPIISDHTFDSLAVLILSNYDSITHPHKKYITKEDLEAGTYLGQYPALAIDSLKLLRKNENL
jgi:hypothetical protein